MLFRPALFVFIISTNCEAMKIYFIIGVSGVGKTSLLHQLKTLLSARKFEIHDFDERGVPDNAGHSWRLDETEYWLNVGKENLKKGVQTVICGFARPLEMEQLFRGSSENVSYYLLDADEETIRKRIEGRYQTDESRREITRVTGKSLEEFIENNVNFSSILREECMKYHCKIIDTSALIPEEVAKEIGAWLEDEEQREFNTERHGFRSSPE